MFSHFQVSTMPLRWLARRTCTMSGIAWALPRNKSTQLNWVCSSWRQPTPPTFHEILPSEFCPSRSTKCQILCCFPTQGLKLTNPRPPPPWNFALGRGAGVRQDGFYPTIAYTLKTQHLFNWMRFWKIWIKIQSKKTIYNEISSYVS